MIDWTQPIELEDGTPVKLHEPYKGVSDGKKYIWIEAGTQLDKHGPVQEYSTVYWYELDGTFGTDVIGRYQRIRNTFKESDVQLDRDWS